MTALALDRAMGMLDDIEVRPREEVRHYVPGEADAEGAPIRGMLYALPLALILWLVLLGIFLL